DLDIGQGEVPWTVLADVEGGAFCVMEEREAYAATGPLAALPLEVADPARGAEVRARVSGWVAADGSVPPTLPQPPPGGPPRGQAPEPAPKRADAKNPIHLDVRLEPGDDADEVAAGIEARGGRELHPDWGELPWRVFQDPSGNELCVLPAAGPAA